MFILIEGMGGLGQGAGLAAELAKFNEANLIIAEEQSRPTGDNEQSQVVTGGDKSTEVQTPRSSGPKRDSGRLAEAQDQLARAEAAIAEIRTNEQQGKKNDTQQAIQNRTNQNIQAQVATRDDQQRANS